MNEEISLKIQAVLDQANAAQGLTDLKKSMRELQGLAIEYADTNTEAFNKVTAAAGQIRDKIADVKQSVSAVSGKPIENLAGSFNLVRQSMTGLDFGQVATGIKLFTENLKNLKPAELTQGFKDVGKAVMDFGKVLLTNPIFLIASVIALVIAKFDELKAAGGIIGKVFTAIGDTIKTVIDALTWFTDLIGLTNVAAQKKTEQTLKSLEKEKAAVQQRYDLESKLATDMGLSATTAEYKKLQAVEDVAKRQVAIYEELKRVNGELTEKQIEDYKKAQEEFQKAQEDNLEFFVRIGSKITEASRTTQFAIRQQQIDAMAEGGAKIAAQEKLTQDRGTIELKKSLEERKADINAYYDNLDAHNQKAGLTFNYDAQRRKEIEKAETDFKLQQTTQRAISAKKERDYSLNLQSSLLGDKAKLLQTYLTYELNNTKNSEKQKLAFQLDTITKQADLSKQQFEIELQKANGNRGKQKALTDQQLADQKIFEENKYNLQKSYSDKLEKLQRQREIDRLDLNIKAAQYEKEFAVTFEKQLDANLVLLRASLDKELLEYKNDYEDKIKVVGLSEAEMQKIKDDYANKVSLAKQAENTRALKLENEFRNQEKQRIAQNELQIAQIELDNKKRTGKLKLAEELKLNRQLSTIKKQILNQQLEDELAAVEKNSIEAARIKEKYAKLSAQVEIDANRTALQANLDSVNQKLNVASYAADTLTALNDLITQNEMQSLKKGEKVSVEMQKRQFNRQKALGIVSAIINTAQGITAALTQAPPYSFIMAALTGVMGAIQIATIASKKFNPESGSDSASGSAPSVPTITAPSISNAPALSSIKSGQFFSAGTARANKVSPVNANNRVYVVESDITNTQNRVAVTQQRSVLSRP